MASKKTSKTSTAETQRVPSTVPNDYDHLGVPGSLNIPLNGSRRRKAQARRRGQRGMPPWLKAILAIGGAFLAFGVVSLVIFIIAFPPFFRGLEPRYQQRLIDMFPPFDALRPTVPFEILPTLSGASDSDSAQQLLLTQSAPQPTGTWLPQAGDLVPASPAPALVESTPVPTPTSGESGGIPVGMVPTLTPTLLPVYASPTPNNIAPTWTPLVIPTEIPLPAQVKLSNIRYESQLWNNCGPTTMTMALSYYGWLQNQDTAAKWMKPHSEDKNVSPSQMVGFVNEVAYSNVGVKALFRIGGNMTLLKRLLAANFPVVVEESIQPAGDGWMGHYLLLIGYDDYQQQFITFDSYLGSGGGQGRPVSYSLFDEHWRHFNRVFIIPYLPDHELTLRAALGPYVDPVYGYQTALAVARDEATRNRDDEWAWFNMGTAYVELKDFVNASIAFDEAFRIGLPFRMLWYQFGPYEAYFRTGRYSDVIARANTVIPTTLYVEESYYWQGMAYAAQGNAQAAIARFNEALKYNRNFFPAQEAKAQVEAGTFAVASAG